MLTFAIYLILLFVLGAFLMTGPSIIFSLQNPSPKRGHS
jgi:hypothetical protein